MTTQPPGVVFIVPALVVLGNLGYLLWLQGEPHGLSGLGAVLFFIFVVIPLSVVFLAAYIVTAQRLLAADRPRGALAISALATLAGLAAGALTAGLVLGGLMLEAKLSG